VTLVSQSLISYQINIFLKATPNPTIILSTSKPPIENDLRLYYVIQLSYVQNQPLNSMAFNTFIKEYDLF